MRKNTGQMIRMIFISFSRMGLLIDPRKMLDCGILISMIFHSGVND